jgi:hypothetical protein
VPRREAEDRRADGRRGIAPLDRGRVGRVDGDHREVTVRVDARDRAAGSATVGKGDRDLLAAKVVGIGEDLAIGDDDARSALVPANADDRITGTFGQ